VNSRARRQPRHQRRNSRAAAWTTPQPREVGRAFGRITDKPALDA
jgi:hypothetical protein